LWVGSVAVAEASMPLAVPPPVGPDSGDLSTSPASFFEGDTITITANFADSQKGKTVFFSKETSIGSGVWDSIGEKTANSSGNASLTGYVINETQKVFASTSAGKETEVDTLTPKADPGGDDEIKACFDRSDGDLNILIPPKSCTSSQKAISWSAQGESSGAGKAFETPTAAVHAITGRFQDVISKELPAGKYVATARLVFRNPSRTEDRTIVCSLDGAGASDTTGFIGVPREGDVGFAEAATMMDAFESGGGSVKVICSVVPEGDEVLVQEARIIVTEVGSIE
jgi:hypothetical protein